MAYRPDFTAPQGRKRATAGRTAAKTPDGLRPFIERHTLAGNVVTTFRVLSIEDVLQ